MHIRSLLGTPYEIGIFCRHELVSRTNKVTTGTSIRLTYGAFDLYGYQYVYVQIVRYSPITFEIPMLLGSGGGISVPAVGRLVPRT